MPNYFVARQEEEMTLGMMTVFLLFDLVSTGQNNNRYSKLFIRWSKYSAPTNVKSIEFITYVIVIYHIIYIIV